MTEAETETEWPDLDALRVAGVARSDAVGWHYIETLAKRTREQSGPAQRKLLAKLHAAVEHLETRLHASPVPQAQQPTMPSPLAALLQDLGGKSLPQVAGQAARWPLENPRVQQFKKQLSQISVQKQVSQALAQAPQNAGPINSHMLVLRSLGLMRDISPDYLNRFMGHVDTLLCLDEAHKARVKPKQAAKVPK